MCEGVKVLIYKSIMSSNTDLKKISNNYNQLKILNLINIIHKKRVLIHIKSLLYG